MLRVMNLRSALSLSMLIAVPTFLAAQHKCTQSAPITISDSHTLIRGTRGLAERVIEGDAFKDYSPLQFADVRLYSGNKLVKSTRTDAHGHFLLESIPIGRYRLSFGHMGTFDVNLTAPHFTQQFHYDFESNHGCLDWGADSD
ncbi:MAG: carboxypeptidase-like regulatory domain-containing protein [Candidatus Sulfotelmatobacter sp.]